MATIDIKRLTATILSPLIDDSSKRTTVLNGDDFIHLTFKHDSFVEILIGDFIEWEGQQYTINQAPGFKKESKREYQYDLRFEGPQYALTKALFLLDYEGEFYLTGTAEDFVDLIVENLNRVYGAATYAKGSVESTDYRNLHFDGEDCLNVLKRLCEEFELEYSFTSTTTINLEEEIGNPSGLSFEYHAGLRNIKRSKANDKDLITRLYAFGSEKNIDYNYGSKRLHLPSNNYPNSYIQRNVNTYGIREAVHRWDDIYPHFEGEVTSTSAKDKVIDTSINFDLNDYLIEGTAAKIVFLTGDLAGYEFDLYEIGGFNYSTKEVYFKIYKDETGQDYPNDTIKPATGDQFTFVDITMPQWYITIAESTLAQAAGKLIDQLSAPNVQYEIDTDWHHLRATSTTLNVGDIITITDTQLTDGNLQFRVLDLNQSIANQYKYTVKIGESIPVGYLKKSINERAKIKRDIVTTRKEFTRDYRRGYQLTEELQDAIFDQDGYFDPENIKPLSIETAMLTVGSKSTQLILTDVIAEPDYQGNPSQFKLSAGTLIHFTIEESIQTWNIAPYTTSSLFEFASYYIYVRCEKGSPSAVWLVSTNHIATDPGGTYYYFLVGILSSAADGVRKISWLYGQTTINGGFIRTGRIESLDGTFWVDLDSGEAELGKATLRTSQTNDYVVIAGQSYVMYDGGNKGVEMITNSGKNGGEIRVYGYAGDFLSLAYDGIGVNETPGADPAIKFGAEQVIIGDGRDLHIDNDLVVFGGTYLTLPSQAQSYKVVCPSGGGDLSYVADSSDRRLKKELKLVTGALEKLLQLNGYTFRFNKKGEKITGHSSEILRAGLVAQELQKVFPAPIQQIGKTDYLSIRYDDLTALIVEAIKEHHSVTEALREDYEVKTEYLTGEVNRLSLEVAELKEVVEKLIDGIW